MLAKQSMTWDVREIVNQTRERVDNGLQIAAGNGALF